MAGSSADLAFFYVRGLVSKYPERKFMVPLKSDS